MREKEVFDKRPHASVRMWILHMYVCTHRQRHTERFSSVKRSVATVYVMAWACTEVSAFAQSSEGLCTPNAFRTDLGALG